MVEIDYIFVLYLYGETIMSKKSFPLLCRNTKDKLNVYRFCNDLLYHAHIYVLKVA